MIKPPIYPKTHRDFCKICNWGLRVEPHEDTTRVRQRVLDAIKAHDSAYSERSCDAPPWHPRAHAFKSGTGLFAKLVKLQLGYVIEWDQVLEPGLTYVARALCLSDEGSSGEVWVEMLGSTFGEPIVQKLRIQDAVALRVTRSIDQHATIRRATRLNHEGLLPINVVETVGVV